MILASKATAHLSVLLEILANIGLGWKGLPGANISLFDLKFITLTPGKEDRAFFQL